MQVVCHSDNQAVVADLRSRSSKHKGMIHLLRSPVFAEARLNCLLFPVYIDITDNAAMHFTRFCVNYAVQTLFPVHKLHFAAYLEPKGLAAQTVKGYLAAVWSAQTSMGLPDPREQSSLPLLRRVQAGISRIRLPLGR